MVTLQRESRVVVQLVHSTTKVHHNFQLKPRSALLNPLSLLLNDVDGVKGISASIQKQEDAKLQSIALSPAFADLATIDSYLSQKVLSTLGTPVIYPLIISSKNDISAKVGALVEPILEGVQNPEGVHMTYDIEAQGGAFVSFKFPVESAEHDIRVGRFTAHSKLMCHSRIKRWWMAPFFASSADYIPIETQLVLAEIDNTKPNIGDLLRSLPNANAYMETALKAIPLSYQGGPLHAQSPVYSVVIPLIDYNNGFRTTLFGGAEGGVPAGSGVLAARVESGDKTVATNAVTNALFVAAGSDPYKLLEYAYRVVSARMGTFRTRDKKPLVPGTDKFGYCTWDAFYSSVDGDKVQTAVDSLKAIGVPPKFVIIDDGWQSTANMRDKRNSNESSSTDGELSGAQIDGGLAAEKILQKQLESEGGIVEKTCASVLAYATRLVTTFYTDVVEKAPPDDWSVKLWTLISRTVIKEILIDFFAKQTDFSKRLTSWKANSKFEDARTGKTLKEFVGRLKSDFGIDKVFVWHALSGYWGGISDETSDDFPQAFAKDIEASYENTITGDLLKVNQAGSKRDTQLTVREVYSRPTPHLLMIEPSLAWDPSSLSGCGTVKLDKLPTMYRLMHSYLAEAGVDGVKVDAQSGIGTFGTGFGGGSVLTRAAVQAVETSAKRAFGMKIDLQLKRRSSRILDRLPKRVQNFLPTWLSRGHPVDVLPADEDAVPLVGCMCHSTENLLAYYETSSARASDDFYPKDMSSQTVHIVSCAYNSVMLSEIVTPDWDMFHSQHEYAEMHASARAISGGPVYVSDSPGKHNLEILRRLVLPSGKVLKCVLPARPTVDCLFKNVMQDGVTALKIWSRNSAGGGVVGVFNTQGSHWSRKDRKYVTDLIKPPFVIGQVKPLDCGVDFVQNHSTGYIAWSSKTQSLSILDNAIAVVETYLPQRGWEIFTMFPILEVKLKNDTELATQKNSQVKMASVQSGNLGVAELKEEVQALQEENDFYRSELLRIRSKLERMGNDSSPELVLRDMISPSWLPPTRSFIDVDGVSVITDIKRKVPGRKRKLLKNIYRNIIPLTATVGFAIARGKGLGVVAKVGAAILGGMAGVLAKMSRSAYKKMASSPSLVKWAPIGLLDMFNPGAAVTYVEPSEVGKVVVFFAQGEGRFGVFCSRRPSKVAVDGADVDTTFDPLTGLLVFDLELAEKLQTKVLENLKNQLVVVEERKVTITW